MINPSLLGRDIARQTLELRALQEKGRVPPERNPRHRRPRHRFRTAIGTRMIAWGESLASGPYSAPVGRWIGWSDRLN